MNNILMIHIGIPKTGTTALQNFLLQNDDKLQKYGWSYPILSEDKTQDMSDIESSGNAFYIYKDSISMGNKQVWEEGMDVVLKHLKNKNVIISAEGISVDGIEQFITGARGKYENVKVVVYLRRQDREIESLYNQHIKNGREHGTFDEYVKSDTNLKKWFNYLSKLDSVSRIIGRENFIVRVYEKQQLIGNDIVTDFLSVLGIPSDQDEWKRDAKMNPSIEGNYLEIKRLINTVQGIEGLFDYREWEDIQTGIFDLCIALSHSYKDKREYGFFTIDQRKEFLEKFVVENEQIAREYLHRGDGILFYDDVADYPLYTMKQDNSFEADMIRMFTAMIYLQNRRIKQLFDQKSEELIGKILMKDILTKSRDRKLLIFGAGHNCHKLFGIVGNVPAAIIADNDLTKHGTVINGVNVMYTGNIADWQDYFVVVTCAETDEIEEQLCSFGLKKDEDYIFMKDYSL
ncbi:MAG: hypothetical protein HDR17_13285 [Lachnospiraceae bacterium]|nr:hypothetical protein [Lachnospiraceae bacterium]